MARSSLPEGDISSSIQNTRPWIGAPVPLFPLLAECLVLIWRRGEGEAGKEKHLAGNSSPVLWEPFYGMAHGASPCHCGSRPVPSEGCICIDSWCLWLVWVKMCQAPSSRKELQGWVPESLERCTGLGCIPALGKLEGKVHWTC